MVALNPLYSERIKPREIYERQPLLHETLSLLELRVQPASRDALIRQGILGKVDSRTGEGVYAENMPEAQQHEIAHSVLGIDGSPRGEYLADTWMLYKTGKIDFFRGPGYRPPVSWN